MLLRDSPGGTPFWKGFTAGCAGAWSGLLICLVFEPAIPAVAGWAGAAALSVAVGLMTGLRARREAAEDAPGPRVLDAGAAPAILPASRVGEPADALATRMERSAAARAL